jgi:DNA-binding IclR family transcriptional regulator
VLGPSTVTTHNWIGRLTPLHCTSSGKVLLAALPPARRAPLLADVEPLTPHTLAPAALAAELERCGTEGWAQAVEEYEVGLNALAAPVRDRSGAVVAAVSVSGPAYRLDEAPGRSGRAAGSRGRGDLARMGWCAAGD